MKRKIFNVGYTYTTKQGYNAEIIEKLGNKKFIVLLDNKHKIECSSNSISKKTTQNPFHPTVMGIGYLGTTDVSIFKDYQNECKRYQNMMNRVNSKASLSNDPQYKGCTIHEYFLSKYNFCMWARENMPVVDGVKFSLDKDLLVEGNMMYSPDTCIFLPHNVNTFLTGNKKRANNRSGHTGIRIERNKWVAFIKDFENPGVQVRLGAFNTQEEAREVREKARAIECEKVVKYLRSLNLPNYYTEDVLSKIK